MYTPRIKRSAGEGRGLERMGTLENQGETLNSRSNETPRSEPRVAHEGTFVRLSFSFVPDGPFFPSFSLPPPLPSPLVAT